MSFSKNFSRKRVKEYGKEKGQRQQKKEW